MSINLGNVYDLVDSYQLADGEYFACQHCGKPIRNICEIKNEEGQIFNVGSSCVKKLLSLDGSDYWKNEEINKKITKYFNGIRLLNKALVIAGDQYFIGVLINNPKYAKDITKTELPYKYKVLNGKDFKLEDFIHKTAYIGDNFDSLNSLENLVYNFTKHNLIKNKN